MTPPETAPANAPRVVPLLDLRRQYEGIREEVLAAIARVCDSQSFILGPEVEALEREIAALTGAAARRRLRVGNRSSLAGACCRRREAWRLGHHHRIQLLRLGQRNCAGRRNADLRRCRSWHAESRRDAGWPASARSAASTTQAENIRAVLPVHLYGQCADMDRFGRIAQEFEVAIVEDAAQAIGAEWNGRGAGSLGITAAFSFYPTKNLSAYGDAGIVTTTCPRMAEHMRRLRNHGSPRRYYHNEFGWNGRMDAIQAAVLRVKLPHIADWNGARQQHAATYDRLFADSGLTSQTGRANQSAAPVRLLARSPQATHVFHQYVIRAQRRDELRKFLTERKIGSEVYYPLPLHLQPVFSYLGLKAGDLPVAEQAAQEVLALPMFPELTEAEIRSVVESIAEFYS